MARWPVRSVKDPEHKPELAQFFAKFSAVWTNPSMLIGRVVEKFQRLTSP